LALLRAFWPPHMVPFLPALLLVLLGAIPAASAVECKAELPPSRSEWWSWRIIDGKRCWYRGRPGTSKANLQWPKGDVPAADVGPGNAQRSAPIGVPQSKALPQPSKPEVTKRKEGLTFKERWPH
jgi:hypothetical protein